MHDRPVFTRILDVIYRGFQALAWVLMGLLIVPVTLQILSRYTGLIPRWIWTEEAARFCFIWIIMVGATIAVRDGTHFEVDVLPTPRTVKGEALTRLLVYFFMLIFTLVFVFNGYAYALFGYNQTSELTGINMVPVHYRGAAPAITDLIAGRVQVMFDVVVSSLSYIKSDKLRVLAVTTATPVDVLPGVPTVGQFVPGYEAAGWQGFCAPSKTPPNIIAKLNREINAALADPKIKERLADLGGQLYGGPPEEFGRFIAAETEKWGKVVRQAGVKAD